MCSKTSNATLGAEILRIATTATETVNFKSSCAKIISRMMKQRGTISRIEQCQILKLLDHFHLHQLNF